MRSSRDQKIGGVCAGAAHYFNIDPTLVRVIWGVLAFGYGAGVLAYGQSLQFQKNFKI